VAEGEETQSLKIDPAAAEPELAQPRGGPARRGAVQNLFGGDEEGDE
jgi:hypothetical protein